jgi:hypothetical protein
MPADDDAGGSGGAPIESTTRDVRLLARAVGEHWDIPEDVRRGIVERLGAVVTDPQAKLRAVLAASKTLAGLSRLNLAGVDVAIRARTHEELDVRVAELELRVGESRAGR